MNIDYNTLWTDIAYILSPKEFFYFGCISFSFFPTCAFHPIGILCISEKIPQRANFHTIFINVIHKCSVVYFTNILLLLITNGH